MVTGAICGGALFIFVDDLASEKKKREKAPAVKAQIFTNL